MSKMSYNYITSLLPPCHSNKVQKGCSHRFSFFFSMLRQRECNKQACLFLSVADAVAHRRRPTTASSPPSAIYKCKPSKNVAVWAHHHEKTTMVTVGEYRSRRQPATASWSPPPASHKNDAFNFPSLPTIYNRVSMINDVRWVILEHMFVCRPGARKSATSV